MGDVHKSKVKSWGFYGIVPNPNIDPPNPNNGQPLAAHAPPGQPRNMTAHAPDSHPGHSAGPPGPPGMMTAHAPDSHPGHASRPPTPGLLPGSSGDDGATPSRSATPVPAGLATLLSREEVETMITRRVMSQWGTLNHLEHRIDEIENSLQDHRVDRLEERLNNLINDLEVESALYARYRRKVVLRPGPNAAGAAAAASASPVSNTKSEPMDDDDDKSWAHPSQQSEAENGSFQ